MAVILDGSRGCDDGGLYTKKVAKEPGFYISLSLPLLLGLIIDIFLLITSPRGWRRRPLGENRTASRWASQIDSACLGDISFAPETHHYRKFESRSLMLD